MSKVCAVCGKEIKLLYGKENYSAIDNGIKYYKGKYSKATEPEK